MSGTMQAASTGSMPLSGGNVAINPIGFGYYPSEGSRGVSLQYNWTVDIGFNEDLSQIVAKGVQTAIQGVWIDNSSNPEAVIMTINGTGQVIVCPGLAQGVFPAFFTGVPGYQIAVQQVAANGATPAVTRLILLNAPVSPQVWYLGPSVGVLKYRASTSVSVNNAAPTTVVLALTYRRSLTLQNPPTNPANFWLNVSGNQGTVGAGLFIVPGGAMVFGSASNPIPLDGISAINDGVAPQNMTVTGG